MLSNLAVGEHMAPLSLDRYDPTKFTTIDKSQVSIVSTPDELHPNLLAEKAISYHIERAGTYALSPFSMNWNQAAEIYTIIGLFKKVSGHVTLSSCRVDAIARDPGLAELINEFGSTNLTCAVEGISEKVCNFLQKSLMPEELYVGMTHIVNQNFRSIKLYYIYTGLETDEDLAELDGHLRRLNEIRRRAGKPNLEMRLSFTPLLSTMGTPLQHHGSKVSRSMKIGDNALYKIKHLCARYNFGVRLSTSIASSDIAQLIEFLDRRGQPLIEYVSLNGVYTFPRISITFYENEIEITKAQYDKLSMSERIELTPFVPSTRAEKLLWLNQNHPSKTVMLQPKTYGMQPESMTWAELYRLDADALDNYQIIDEGADPNFPFVYDEKEVFDVILSSLNCPTRSAYYQTPNPQKITLNKLYALMNAESLYPELSINKLIEMLRYYNGRVIPQTILDAFPARRKKALTGRKVRILEGEGEDYVTELAPGNKLFTLFVNVNINDISADIIKSWVPLFTGGNTFNQLAVANHDALHIFPSYIVKLHKSQHIGQNFKQYVSNRANLFDSYCFPDTLAKSLPMGTKVMARFVSGSSEPTQLVTYAQHEEERLHGNPFPSAGV